ncbi:hypothetical protein AB0J68_02455, partial [Micromonospora sp. NPDC049580]
MTDIRVLVVEDEPLLAEAHAAYTERVRGFVVVGVAHTARAAMAALRAGGISGSAAHLTGSMPGGQGMATAAGW